MRRPSLLHAPTSKALRDPPLPPTSKRGEGEGEDVSPLFCRYQAATLLLLSPSREKQREGEEKGSSTWSYSPFNHLCILLATVDDNPFKLSPPFGLKRQQVGVKSLWHIVLISLSNYLLTSSCRTTRVVAWLARHGIGIARNPKYFKPISASHSDIKTGHESALARSCGGRPLLHRSNFEGPTEISITADIQERRGRRGKMSSSVLAANQALPWLLLSAVEGEATRRKRRKGGSSAAF
nr:hypothetical protein Iba_chr13eCG9820 [Ipomoea batatas]